MARELLAFIRHFLGPVLLLIERRYPVQPLSGMRRSKAAMGFGNTEYGIRALRFAYILFAGQRLYTFDLDTIIIIK